MKKSDFFDFTNMDDDIIASIAESYPDMSKQQRRRICRKTRRKLRISQITEIGDQVSGTEPAKKRRWYVCGTAAAALLVLAAVPAMFTAIRHIPNEPDTLEQQSVIADMIVTTEKENDTLSSAASIPMTKENSAVTVPISKTEAITDKKSENKTEPTKDVPKVSEYDTEPTKNTESEENTEPEEISVSPMTKQTVKTTETPNVQTEAVSNTTEPAAKTTAVPVATEPLIDKEQLLKKLEAEESRMICTYVRQRKVINGEMSPDAPRLTLEQAQNIIAEQDPPTGMYDREYASRIIEAFNEICGCPDVIGGSGITRYEYWLNENDSECIIIFIEQIDIVYVNVDSHPPALSLIS